MRVVIAETFTREEATEAGDAQCVTPQSFSAVKDWAGVEVSGLKYYVDKAVKLGAIKPKQTRKKKVDPVETPEQSEE